MQKFKYFLDISKTYYLKNIRSTPFRLRWIRLNYIYNCVNTIGRSPVTVQEWVATLPSVDNHEVQENIEDKVTGKESNNASNEDIDNIKLGEEGNFISFSSN